jgi:hypothetical protein
MLDARAEAPTGYRIGSSTFIQDTNRAEYAVEVPDLIDIAAEIAFDQRYRADAVRQGVTDALAATLAFDTVDFGAPVYLSTAHDAMLRVPGVRTANLRRFRRSGADGDAGLEAALAAANLPALADLPPVLRSALAGQIEADGRIELDYDEIPVVGLIELTLVVAPL